VGLYVPETFASDYKRAVDNVSSIRRMLTSTLSSLRMMHVGRRKLVYRYTTVACNVMYPYPYSYRQDVTGIGVITHVSPIDDRFRVVDNYTRIGNLRQRAIARSSRVPRIRTMYAMNSIMLWENKYYLINVQ